jgi:hypothetical protein
MTHTLYRKGDRASLEEDFILLMTPAQEVNVEGSLEKIRKVWEIISHYKPDLSNFGNSRDGNSHRTTIEALQNGNYYFAHAVFKNRDALKACLKELKDRDFGISVVISGIYDEVEKICKEVGLSPHTVAHSLGIHGKTEKLPDENTLEIITMCGHGIVSCHLVKKMVEKINDGKLTHAEAAKELSRVCDCGVFNSYRAEKLLREMTSPAPSRMGGQEI